MKMLPNKFLIFRNDTFYGIKYNFVFKKLKPDSKAEYKNADGMAMIKTSDCSTMVLMLSLKLSLSRLKFTSLR